MKFVLDTNVLISASGMKHSYREIIKKDESNRTIIEKNGGDCSTLKVDTIGERLLEQTRAGGR